MTRWQASLDDPIPLTGGELVTLDHNARNALVR
jgi:hypothetical protein